MTEREELAEALARAYSASPYRDAHLRGADAILAAGYRKAPEPAVAEEMVDLIQYHLYDDVREGDRAAIREALEAVFQLRREA